jgi:hypothetical protein
MEKVANLAVIDDHHRLLLVRKKGIWMLPGGRKHLGETNVECLSREIAHGLGTPPIINDFYKRFSGRIHQGEKGFAEVNVYFGGLEKEMHPRYGIEAARFFDRIQSPKFWIYDKNCSSRKGSYCISNITADIVESLKKDNYIE